MSNIILVGIGGFVGSALRYQIGLIMFNKFGNAFPYGTLLVNLIGSFLIGGLLASFVKSNPSMVLLLVSGFCGGFTTFSAFSIENIKLLEDGNISAFLIYVFTSLIGGISLCGLGYLIAKNYLEVN